MATSSGKVTPKGSCSTRHWTQGWCPCSQPTEGVLAQPLGHEGCVHPVFQHPSRELVSVLRRAAYIIYGVQCQMQRQVPSLGLRSQSPPSLIHGRWVNPRDCNLHWDALDTWFVVGCMLIVWLSPHLSPDLQKGQKCEGDSYTPAFRVPRAPGQRAGGWEPLCAGEVGT